MTFAAHFRSASKERAESYISHGHAWRHVVAHGSRGHVYMAGFALAREVTSSHR